MLNKKFKFRSRSIAPLPEVSIDDYEDLMRKSYILQNTDKSNQLPNVSTISEEEKHYYNISEYYSYINPGGNNTFTNISPIDFANSIVTQNNIKVFYMDHTWIYVSPSYKEYITKQSIKNILSDYQPISDKTLCSTFQINNSDLYRLKKALLSNPFLEFIQNKDLSYEDALDVIQIILAPSGKILNPLIVKIIKHDCTTPPEEELRDDCDWIHQLKKTLNPVYLPGKYHEIYNEKYQKPINSMLFNTTHQEFLEACFPNDTAQQIQEKLYNLEKSFPFNLISFTPKNVKIISDFIINNSDFNAGNRIYPFRLFPPTQDQLISIFYFQQKSRPPQCHIFYNNSTNLIHYAAVAKLLSHNKITKNIIAQNTNQESIKAYLDTRNIYLSKFYLSENLLDIYRQNLGCYLSLYLEEMNAINPKSFEKLQSTLFYMFKGNTDSLDNLAELIAKVYLGRDIFSEINKPNNTNGNNVTIIYSKNIHYLRRLCHDIFNFNICSPKLGLPNANSQIYNITEYSLKELSNKDTLPNFIINKLFGSIVNIDTTNFIPEDLSQFKKLAAGSKVFIPDNTLNEITYRSNIHYIFISDNIEKLENAFSSIPHCTILTDDCLESHQYMELDSYEYLFLVLGLINYSIDKYLNPPIHSIKNQLSPNQSLSLKELVNTFITNFCDDSTNTISQDDLNKIRWDQVPPSSNNKERKELGKSIGIDKLTTFITKDDFYFKFSEWAKIAFPNYPIMEDDFFATLREKYHPLFYIKKFTTNLAGEKKEFRGYTGISIKLNVLDTYINDYKSKISAKNNQEIESKFTTYLENLINNYMPTPE